ncbi:ribonuclease E [Thalassolituus oleivorans]|uniref:di-heme-cytochrome C peroxidase n=1 Tax=Thalassolituus oleivorans TaxID=187493 RepID=UPI0009492E23|nr:di-heme-cytochrome C peroxidase [Thalassolituus oleivorans]APR65642.1 ribonuclease E [Thalassolituus oleivorans]
MATLFQKLFAIIVWLYKYKWRLLGSVIGLMTISLLLGKLYQHWDDDPDRGAVAMANGAFGESYSTPVYLDQGWSESESLWFYNTTQGSGLLPYDLYLSLEESSSQRLLRDNTNMDKYRYLPQKPTFFNPDGLAVGFVKDEYQGKDYVGFTCAACHTSQVNFKGQAIRIDGGPAMSDISGFFAELEKSMMATLTDSAKQQRFIANVLALENNYKNADQVVADLKKWSGTIHLYNTVNHSHVKYGYARLDAFGRIYNRVLQHMINKEQLSNAMKLAVSPTGVRILTDAQITNVLAGVGENIIVDSQFSKIINRLASHDQGYPGLNLRDLLRVRDQIFNEADAPVSYPFLWDIGQSDYVQWNGLAQNYALGPLGRNTGEVIGVFGILDWTAEEPSHFDLSSLLTDQKNKNKVVNFKSSIDLTNLQRLEAQLQRLQSPVWPQEILGKIDTVKAERGQTLFAQYCQACHVVVDRANSKRLVVASMIDIDIVGTDKKMALNGVQYAGKSGNLKDTVQATDVGNVVIREDAPVVQILTSATKGVIATPDADKWFLRRWLDRLYTLGLSFFDNDIPNTVKSGNYKSDTTSNPYNSLLAYKGRSLNGIWATAPYLHNGSVPTLYDLLLPKKRAGDPDDGEYRPDSFVVGAREFDPVKVGFISAGYDGFTYNTSIALDRPVEGNDNAGHEYAAGKTPQLNGSVLPALNEQQRWDLIEYLKTL